MSPEILPWIFFNIFIVFMLALDLFIFHRKKHSIEIKESIAWTAFWIFLALLFNVYIYYSRGHEDALNFFTGYLIEKSLSVDNLFVFLLIFKYFHTPKILQHGVLFWGVLGAIIIRGIFIAVGIVLIEQFHWMIYIMGAFLVIAGIKLGFGEEKMVEPEKNFVLKIVRRFVTVSDTYEGGNFFIKNGARYIATPLFIVVMAIETTDIVFAMDSIPAIFAITLDPFIVYTSNIFAILGLRSLFFSLQHMMGVFQHLNYGLALILVFIGIKMILADIIVIPILLALGIVFSILFITILWSVFTQKKLIK